MRDQIQAEAMNVGVAMQHLGAMLLELGRTIMTLRMGQSPVSDVYSLLLLFCTQFVEWLLHKYLWNIIC